MDGRRARLKSDWRFVMRDPDEGTRDQSPGSADIAGAVLFGVASIALIALAPPAKEAAHPVRPAVRPRFEFKETDKIAWASAMGAPLVRHCRRAEPARRHRDVLTAGKTFAGRRGFCLSRKRRVRRVSHMCRAVRVACRLHGFTNTFHGHEDTRGAATEAERT